MRFWNSELGVLCCALSGVSKRFRQFGCAEPIEDAFEAASRCGDADFGSRTGQTTHQQTRMSQDAAF
jgi:hypothetical protein